MTSRPPKAPRRIPFEFVLDELQPLPVRTNPMFGAVAVYVGERIVFCLRDRPSAPEDNGVWVATTREHHASLRADLPSLRTIGVLGTGDTGWQNLPAQSPTFEREVQRACALIVAGDPRIGKVPKGKRRPADPGVAAPSKRPRRAD